MPFYVRVPGRSSAAVAPQVSLVDLAPTFADLAGTSMPNSRGISLKDLILDRQASLSRQWVFIESPRRANNWQAVRSQDSKYVAYARGFKEFYDLVADPYELTNRANHPAYAARVAEAQSALAQLRP